MQTYGAAALKLYERLITDMITDAEGKNIKGFTLIELMIVIAIIAVLASIALTSYSAYILRGKLIEAPTILKSTASAMEAGYDTGYSCDKSLTKNVWQTKYFRYECIVPADLSSFKITASGIQTDISNYSYSINSDGQHKTEAHPSGPNDKCWLVSGKEC